MIIGQVNGDVLQEGHTQGGVGKGCVLMSGSETPHTEGELGGAPFPCLPQLPLWPPLTHLSHVKRVLETGVHEVAAHLRGQARPFGPQVGFLGVTWVICKQEGGRKCGRDEGGLVGSLGPSAGRRGE